jgi:hypothetical protein
VPTVSTSSIEWTVIAENVGVVVSRCEDHGDACGDGVAHDAEVRMILRERRGSAARIHPIAVGDDERAEAARRELIDQVVVDLVDVR